MLPNFKVQLFWNDVFTESKRVAPVYCAEKDYFFQLLSFKNKQRTGNIIFL